MAVLRYFHKVPKATTSTTVVDNTAVQTITAALNTKADKVVGKGFSQNNYSTIEKTKLSKTYNRFNTKIIRELK